MSDAADVVDHYATVGVNYGNLDPFKLMCQQAGLETTQFLAERGLGEVPESRGESCALIDMGDHYAGQVIEGLGTKNLVAQAMQDLTGSAHWWEGIGQDSLAMILNDLICLGARPVSVLMYAAVGHDDWLKPDTEIKQERMEALVRGWKNGCITCRCAWVGGETPGLPKVVCPEAIDMAGAAFGIVRPKTDLLIGHKIRIGDTIIMVGSSGIHSNGISGARDVADNMLPNGYMTPCGDSTFGAQILRPTILYSPLVENWLDLTGRVDIRYTMNITGHGLKKVMRAEQPFSYVITSIPEPQPVFRLIQGAKGLSDEEMYRTYNMGNGFAAIVSKDTVTAAVATANEMGFEAWIAGEVREAIDGQKSVYIEPLGITYDDLAVR